MDYKPHPLADIFPLISGAEFVDLKNDIKANGLKIPVIIYEGKILDGRNRFRACQEVGVDVRCEQYEGNDPLADVISWNLKRRHLDEGQRAIVSAKLANMQRTDTLKQNRSANLQNGESQISQSQAAQMLNVSERSVSSAKKVLNEGAKELIEKVEQGNVSVSAAAEIATLPKEEQSEIVAKGEKEILQAAKDIRLKRAEIKREELALIKQQNPITIPDGKYSCIVIDPPWDMKKIDRDITPDQVEFDYPTMTQDELLNFDVAKMAHDDCHLFCWTTQKYLIPALELIEHWGFKYVLTMVWHKNGGFQPFGLPQYNCEFVVYARKGTPKFIDTKAFNCCFNAPRREHSRKPDEFYELIKRVTDGSRIDVFSREKREGFAQFGNEVDKFAA